MSLFKLLIAIVTILAPFAVFGSSLAAKPTLRELMSIEKKATEAWVKADARFFEEVLSEEFVSFKDGFRIGREDLIKMVSVSRCEMAHSSFEDAQMATIGSDLYVVSYQAAFDGRCSMPDGSEIKLLSPVRAASVYVREGKKWKSVFHSETLIRAFADKPKNSGPDRLTARPSSEVGSTSSRRPTLGAGDDTTNLLVARHETLWEAISAGKTKRLGQMTTDRISSVIPTGDWLVGKSSLTKRWKAMKCDQVSNVLVTDGVATSIAPNFDLLTAKLTMNGRCDNRANLSIYHAAIYQRVGTARKLAFLFESPAK